MDDRLLSDPVIAPETEDFWAAASQGRFLVRRCTACGRAHWYPRFICPLCASTETEWIEASGRGKIYSYSVMRRAKAPFIIAYVTIEEGPTMMTNLVDCDPERVTIGDEVTLVFKKSEGGYAVPCFTPRV